MITFEDLEKARDAWDRMAIEAIQARAHYKELDALKKPLRASIFLTLKGTIAEKEAIIETSEEWKKHVKESLMASVEAEIKEHHVENLAKIWQTLYLQIKQQEQDMLRSFAGR